MTAHPVPVREDRLPRPLPDVVAGLLDPRRRKILVEGRDPADGALRLEVREAAVRPLWAELVAAARPSGQAGGGGRGGGLPLSLEALDLADRVRDVADSWARARELPWLPEPRRCVACGTAVVLCEILATYRLICCARCDRHPRPDRAARALRRLAVAHWPDPAERDQLARILDRLAEQADALLAGDQTSQYVRDTRCPRCWAWDVTEQDQVIRAPVRHPALLLVRARERVVGTTCTACTAWWPWDGMGADGALAAELADDRGRQAAEGHVRAC
jgi:hypothetical protein